MKYGPVADNEVHVGTKRVKLTGKTIAQLEHLYQLMTGEIVRYKSIPNYPPDRMEKYGNAHLVLLESYLAKIQEAIKALK